MPRGLRAGFRLADAPILRVAESRHGIVHDPDGHRSLTSGGLRPGATTAAPIPPRISLRFRTRKYGTARARCLPVAARVRCGTDKHPPECHAVNAATGIPIALACDCGRGSEGWSDASERATSAGLAVCQSATASEAHRRRVVTTLRVTYGC